MLRSDDAPDLLRAFERRDYLLSDAGQFEQQQTRADAEAAASAAREQARTWRRSLGAGDTVPDEDAYDFDAMALGEVWPKPDGAGRVPLPPRYWKPGRLTLAGYDIATGRRVLSSAPLEERLLSGEMDEPDDVATIEDVFARATPEDFAELSTVERRALESWAEAHGVMLAQAGGTATMTDVPAGQSVARVGRAGVPRQPIDSRTVTQPAQALWDSLAGGLKGAVAQTLGLPGDIEALVRLLTGTEDGQHMVTTEGVSDLLPDVTTDPARMPSAAAGQFAGELGGLGGAPTKGVKAAIAGARKLAPVAEELVRKGAEQIVWRSGGVMGALPRADDIQSFSVGPSRITPKVIAEGRPLYRETNVSGLDDIMRLDDQYDYHRVFVADRPELALGQGQNRGVIVEFRPNALSGAEHRKPMTGDIAGREYVTDVIAPKPVQSITFESAKDVRKLRGLTARKLASFTREDLADGKVRFTRKPEAGQ